MVEDDASLLALPAGIGTVVDIFLLSAAEADEADDVVGTGLHGVVAQGDARVGGCLTEDGDIVLKLEVAPECNNTSNVEHDGAVSATGDGSTERARTAVVEVGDVYDVAGASASDIAAVPLSAREGRGVVSHSRYT